MKEDLRQGRDAYGEFEVLFEELGASVSFEYDTLSCEELNAINELREIVEATTPPPVISVTGS
jgi:hypothetical protein